MTAQQLFIEPFSFGFMQRGALSVVLLSITGGLLGPILILRRLALMGDALSHSLLPGIAFAYLLFGANLLALFLGGLFAGLITAAASALLSRMTRVKEDAAFGSLFVIFFAVGIALISAMKTRVDFMQFLFGNVLAVGSRDLALAGFACVLTAAVFGIFHRSVFLETFDPIFFRATGGRGGLTHVGLLCLVALNLVAALQAMGVVLALGLFLLPAVTAYLWCDRLRHLLAVSVAVALIGSLLGILLSYHANVPSGAGIVLTLGAGFILSAIGSPRHGVLVRLRANRGEVRRILHTPE
ncbi:MAG TPA: metal ABC transporter permease [Opitutaceae bacterium]|nr:metal ABC transporter permease [Opitutaceae bacterium]